LQRVGGVEHQLPRTAGTPAAGDDAERPASGNRRGGRGCGHWFRIGPGQPILREPDRGFLVGDLILLETDRRRFPREARLADALCVVRFPGGSPPLQLAAVWRGADEGDYGLRCDPFDLDPASLVEKVTYYRYPDGRVTCNSEKFVMKESRGKKRVLPLDSSELTPVRPRIAYADVVAVRTGILHRPGGVLVE
jgi:hypothetical protein